MSKSIYKYAMGVVVGIGLSLVSSHLFSRWREPACTTEIVVKDSAMHEWKSTLTYKLCGWGLGLNADTATLRIDKRNLNGWFSITELELDPDALHAPTMEWKDSNRLQVTMFSTEYTGSVTRKYMGGLQVVRSYAPN